MLCRLTSVLNGNHIYCPVYNDTSCIILAKMKWKTSTPVYIMTANFGSPRLMLGQHCRQYVLAYCRINAYS